MTETDVQKRIKSSQTRIFKAIFPNTTNSYNTLFGGTALSLMDEVAYMTAIRFARKKMVTVSSDKIDFKQPIPSGSIMELIGTVTRVGRTSLTIDVEIFLEKMYEDGREKAIEGVFTFVAIDDNGNSAPVLD